MKALKHTIAAVLLLFFMHTAAAYTFTISGNIKDGGQPAVGYEVMAYSQDWLYYQVAYTNFMGNYSLVFDFPTGTAPVMTVSTYYICPEDEYEQTVSAFPGALTVNFDLCNPTNNCSAYFYVEHEQPGPLTLQFVDNSWIQDGTYFWDFGDGSTSTEQNPAHTFSSPGYKQVSLAVSNGICSDTASYWVLVGDLAACNCPSYFAMQCYTLPDGTEVTFTNECEAACYGYPDATPCYDTSSCFTYFFYHADTASSNTLAFFNLSFGVVTSYLWDFGDGTTSTEANPVHTYAQDGGYLVTLSIATETGCTDFYYSLVYIGNGCNCPQVYEPVCAATPLGIEIIIENSCIADCIGLSDYEDCYEPLFCEAVFSVTQPDSTVFTYQFTNNSTGQGLSYYWDFGDGNASVDENPVHTYANEGWYTVWLEVIGSDGCYSYSVYHLEVGDGQADCFASFYYNNDWQDSLNVLFYDQSFSFTGSQAVSWFWDFGDGNFSSEQNPSYAYNSGGAYSVTLTVGFSDGCQSTTTYHVWVGWNGGFCVCPGDYDPVCVEQPGGIYFTFNNACFAECSGYFDYVDCDSVASCQASYYYYQDGNDSLTVFFVDYSFGNVTNWLWNFGDGTVSTQQNPSHSFPALGEYQVSLTITTDAGCTSTITYPVYLYDHTGLPACYAYYWFEQDPNNLLAFNFVDYSAPGVDTWYWNFGDGQTSTEQNPSITYAQPGVYLASLTATDEDANCTNTYSMLVWADTLAYYGAACQALFIPQVSGMEVSYFNLSSFFGGESYTWDFGDGNASSEENPTHLYAQPGTYTTTLTTTNADGCTSSFSVTINLMNGQFWGNSAPSALLLLSDTKEVAAESDDLSISPNPAGDFTNLFWDKKTETATGEARLSLQNMAGQVVWNLDYQAISGGQQVQIPLAGLPSGLYLLKIADGTQQRHLKLVKE
jgi:PKD repeat protein